MKTNLRNLGLIPPVALASLGLVPLACDVHEPDLDAVQHFCSQMGWTYGDPDGDGEEQPVGNLYEFRPVGLHPDNFGVCHPDGYNPTAGCDDGLPDDHEIPAPMGSFEGEFWVKAGTLIADDDDLTDDLPAYQEALALAQTLLSEDLDAVETYKNMDPDKEETAFSAAESDAVNFVASVVSELLAYCPRLTDDDATGIPPRPGDDLLDGTFPSFTACKDKFDASGDGVVATFDLLRDGGAEQDATLASCLTTSAGRNRNALNVWGPLTTQKSDIEGLPNDVVDGFTYSGITIPLETSAWKWTIDRSEWEGVAFWARLATAGEAVPIQPNPRDQQPLSGGPIPEGARPQDGVGQVGIIIQTFDTGAVYNERGEMDFMNQVGVCAEGQAPPAYLCFETQEEFDDFPGMVVPGNPDLKYAYASEIGEDPDPSVRWSKGTPTTPEHPFCVDYSPVDIIVGEEPSYRDHCWDGFRTMIDVTPEWKYYFLPFSEMRQAGWGRAAKSFRTDQLRSINILTSAYQPINIMVDEIAFYRRKSSKNSEGAAGAGGAGD